MLKYLLFIIVFLSSTQAFTQNTFNKNDVYAEFLGNGIAASVNYERQLQNKPGAGVRVGMGYFSGDQQFRISIPVGVNYLFKLSNNISFIDVGIGGTWSPAAGLKTAKQDAAAGGRNYSEHIWSVVPGIGYRRHTKGGFMWRASFTPILNKYVQIPWLGLSVGKRF